MPAPAAQFSPELPWAAGTRGTIILKDPVSKDDLLNGALTFVGVNGLLYQPEGSDGYVDYRDENDSTVLAIAFDDDETKNVLKVGVAQDAEVQRVVVGPAVGVVEVFNFVNENLQDLQVGESGFIVVVGYKEPDSNYSLLTQDGQKGVTCKRIADIDDTPVYELFNREAPQTILSTMKLPAATPGGDLANLPKILADIYDDSGNAVLRALHAPADNQAAGAQRLTLADGQTYQFVLMGDQVRQLVIF